MVGCRRKSKFHFGRIGFRMVGLIIVILLPGLSSGEQDSSEVLNSNLYSEVKDLKHEVEIIKRDQLNYKLEKDILKDVYSSNHERLNFSITLILVVSGFLGFFGLRDINSLKKEYQTELQKLKMLKSDTESKFKEFESDKARFDKDIGEILKQNEEQNKKLKILEIKEKIDRSIEDKQLSRALEFCSIALDMEPENCDLLVRKAQIYSRLRQYVDAIKVLKKVLDLDSDHQTAIVNLCEVYAFNNNEKEFYELLPRAEEYLSSKSDGSLIGYFKLIFKYHKDDLINVKQIILENIDKSNVEKSTKRVIGWDLYDAMVFCVGLPETEIAEIIQYYTWYLDGKIPSKSVIDLCEI